jgi:hypothetical protein
MAKKKRRPPKEPQIEYMHEKTSKDLINKALKKYGSLRQVALNLGCSVGHIYRFNDKTCRMSKSWYEKLQKLVY